VEPGKKLNPPQHIHAQNANTIVQVIVLADVEDNALLFVSVDATVAAGLVGRELHIEVNSMVQELAIVLLRITLVK
jgi:hypothetical protein